jgi:transposase InsO family protein
MMAHALGVTERTIRNWMRYADSPPKKQGRPGHGAALRTETLEEVKKQRALQGKQAGWRPIRGALPAAYPTRLIQEELGALKSGKRRRKRTRLRRVAEQVKVERKDVIWAQDGAQVGRIEEDPVEAQLIKDRGPLKHVASWTGPRADTEDVIALLRWAKEKQGALCLVWQTDNDSSYVSRSTARFLEQERVIHLKSRVHRPTDNGAAERAVCEMRSMTGLKRDSRLKSYAKTSRKVEAGIRQLDTHRLRGSRGYVSAEVLAKKMPSWYDAVDRETFYWEARAAMKSAVAGLAGDRARKAERDAIHGVLEKYGLITWTRGGGNETQGALEIIS